MIDVVRVGDGGRPVVVFHGGTPFAPVATGPIVDAVLEAGASLVTYARPGYAGSTRQVGRSIADAVVDVAAITDFLGIREFVTLGWSGGGPHALACAARMPGCRGAATIGGVGPYGAPDLDFLAGMGEDNVREFGAALEGPDALARSLGSAATELATITGADVAEALGGLLSDIDRAALTPAMADWLAAGIREAVSTGIDGWLDDDLAFVQPWGFDLASIGVPVTIWQGHHDLMVPPAHGRWLASSVPPARARLLPDEGHVSLLGPRAGDIVKDLLSSVG